MSYLTFHSGSNSQIYSTFIKAKAEIYYIKTPKHQTKIHFCLCLLVYLCVCVFSIVIHLNIFMIIRIFDKMQRNINTTNVSMKEEMQKAGDKYGGPKPSLSM